MVAGLLLVGIATTTQVLGGARSGGAGRNENCQPLFVMHSDGAGGPNWALFRTPKFMGARSLEKARILAKLMWYIFIRV